MTIEEAEAEIRRLKKWIEDEKASIRAASEAVLVEANAVKEDLCRAAARNVGIDAWKLKGKGGNAQYKKIRSVVYWKMHSLGYDSKIIAKVFGREHDVIGAIGFVESRLRANWRMKDAAERIFEA